MMNIGRKKLSKKFIRRKMHLRMPRRKLRRPQKLWETLQI